MRRTAFPALSEALPLGRRALLHRGVGAALGAGSLGWLGWLGCRAAEPAGLTPTLVASPEVRAVARVVPGVPTRDGAGVNLRRVIGGALRDLDPFLLLDEIRSDRPGEYVRGFPRHPHRGFETVTIMLHGVMEHEDSVGNRGLLTSGAVQWMTAGRGIVHSEMPRQEQGLLWGLQLWVNLPRAQKMTAPRYQDVPADRIAEVGLGSHSARLVAGSLAGTEGAVSGIGVAPTLLDARVVPGSPLVAELPAAHAAFAYVLEGEALVGAPGTRVGRGELAVLGPGAALRAETREGARLLVVAAKAIGEPIARRGPFVMNTEAELDQAFDDYRSGRLTSG